ncbi:Uncharacterised protein [Mycobacteroides abscessus]|nr:Uncharacterised protein [Mycobacteroides abscessus]
MTAAGPTWAVDDPLIACIVTTPRSSAAISRAPESPRRRPASSERSAAMRCMSPPP